MNGPVELSPLASRKAAALGSEGQRWIDSLPDLVAQLEGEWGVDIGASLMGGSASFVASATTLDGRDAVLKIAMPDGLEGQGEFARELRAVRLGQGRGYVELLRSDADRRVMLQERLGPPLADTGRTIEDQLDVIARTLAPAWQPDPTFDRWWTGAEQANALAVAVRADWATCGEPCAEGVIALAEACAQSRRDDFDAASAVVIHGDAHSWNVLEESAPDFKVIDPDAMLSHPAHDLAIPIRHWNDELLQDRDPAARVRRWCAQLSDVSGAPGDDIWEWAFVERVSTGLFLLRLGDASGRQFLAIAEALSQD